MADPAPASPPTGLVDGEQVAPHTREAGHIRGQWRDLGRAAGTRTVGLRRITIEEGAFSTPVHRHGVEEEIFFVLAGAGLLWQGGRTYSLAAGDCIVHEPQGEAHTLRGGAGGLDVLAFGQRVDPAPAILPRAGVAWAGESWVEVGPGDHPWQREAAAGPPECPAPEARRPRNVVALDEVAPVFGGMLRRLARQAGAQASGLSHIALPPESSGAPPHCHSLEEEIFVVLEGEGTLVLSEQPRQSPGEYPVRRGFVVARPAGTGVAHAFRSGAQGMTLLAYGTREANDMAFYPATGTVALRGLGVSFRPPGLEQLPGRG
jgi:uncharacterized cupin superfamily protein